MLFKLAPMRALTKLIPLPTIAAIHPEATVATPSKVCPKAIFHDSTGAAMKQSAETAIMKTATPKQNVGSTSGRAMSCAVRGSTLYIGVPS